MQFNTFATLAIVAVSGALACADNTAPAAGRPISVSFSTAPASGASFARTAAPGASLDLTSTVGTDVLVITKVQLVVARIELQQSGATCASTTASGDDEGDQRHESECAELQVAPSIVNLPVNGTVVSALDISIPPGTYSALEAKIRPLRNDSDHGQGSSAFLTAHPELNGVSVVVEGTFNGTPFTYKGAARSELERRFDPPLVIDASPLNITVNVDLASWFRSQSGGLIDPSTANAGGANAATVADNIKRSFRAFRDDDHNGQDDDDRGGHS